MQKEEREGAALEDRGRDIEPGIKEQTEDHAAKRGLAGRTALARTQDQGEHRHADGRAGDGGDHGVRGRRRGAAGVRQLRKRGTEDFRMVPYLRGGSGSGTVNGVGD